MMLPSFEQVWKNLNKKYPKLLRESQEFSETYKDFVNFEKVAIEEGLLLEGDPKKGFDYDDSLLEAERLWERDPYITIEVLKAYYEELYDDLESDLYYMEGKDIWRSLSLPLELDHTTVDPIGVYWSRSKGGAGSYWGWETKGPTKDVVFLAEAPSLSGVDLTGTLEANFVPEFGSEERELRLKKGIPIYLISVTLPDGSEISIQDWRTT